MFYQEKLDFFMNLMKEFGLPAHLATKSSFGEQDFDLSLRSFLGLHKELENAFEHLQLSVPKKTLCKITDDFFCSWLVLRLPDCEEETFLIMGPYVKSELFTEDVYRTIEKYHVAPRMAQSIVRFFSNVTKLSDNSAVFSILNVFAQELWGSDRSSYSHKEISWPLNMEKLADTASLYQEDITEQKEIAFQMQLLEERYAYENRFIKNISLGNVQNVEAMFDSNTRLVIEPRMKDSFRNLKNYSIILNTLLRKGAELGGVHPFHLDRISSIYARKIEELQTFEQSEQLSKEMVRKYGLLVQNHSMKNYSLPVQKVITRIDLGLAADHSLSTNAKLLNISPSYLSTLFRKETGMTLTEYVNRRRAEHGVFLLNTTSMQIQTIALHCGISDLNYFTRIFKKYIGKTSSEYKNSIGN